jgi:hypothetical protein
MLNKTEQKILNENKDIFSITEVIYARIGYNRQVKACEALIEKGLLVRIGGNVEREKKNNASKLKRYATHIYKKI